MIKLVRLRRGRPDSHGLPQLPGHGGPESHCEEDGGSFVRGIKPLAVGHCSCALIEALEKGTCAEDGDIPYSPFSLIVVDFYLRLAMCIFFPKWISYVVRCANRFVSSSDGLLCHA